MSSRVIRYIGGETGHRSFFGGSHSAARIVLLGICFVGGLFGTLTLGWPALAAAVVGAGLTLLATARTHRGTLLERRRVRSRWAWRQRTGFDRFVPFSDGAWERAQERAAGARGRTAKWEAATDLAALRTAPDGATGLGWLQSARGVPGIAWHSPMDQPDYLSVVFQVAGQLRGIESEATTNRAAVSWGAFLAAKASPMSLARRVQTLTRVLPSDSTFQEFWALEALDKEIPVELTDAYDAARESYAEVIRKASAGAMVQRHFIVVCWPLSSAFTDQASKYGPAREGWRQLMAHEIAGTTAALTEARMGEVSVLTARQVAAVMMHQQNPSRPIDLIAGLDPALPGLASHDEFSAHVVDDVDPLTGAPVTWWHRTCRILPESMESGGRTPLWTFDLVVGGEVDAVRSVSFHEALIPAAEAKAAARSDLVRDQAERLSRQQAGQIDTGDSDAQMSAAQRRSSDLVSGSNHHGVEWAGFITVSARSREQLSVACRQLVDVCSTKLGIERLEWQDSMQSAASGTTWPLGRGLAPSAPSMSARLYSGLAGTTEKESL